MKNVLFVSLVFASAGILMAQQANRGEFNTEIRQINQQMSVVITGYNGTSKQIHIPAQIDGLPVVAIGDNAFRSRRIESVTFPATLVSIGNYAFYDNNLKVISIPPAVITIGVGAFDSNALGRNASPNQTETPYTRTFTIEPAHSETVYRPTPNQSAPETVNIIVVPGYNPLRPFSTGSNGSSVTIQQSPNPAQAVTVPAARTVAETNQMGAIASAERPNSPVRPNQTAAQQPYGQPQQRYGYVQQTLPASTGRRLNVIPENTIDLSTGQSGAPVTEEKTEDTKSIKLYMTETYSIGSNPTPR
jgi:hypothetical protein